MYVGQVTYIKSVNKVLYWDELFFFSRNAFARRVFKRRKQKNKGIATLLPDT